MEKQTQLTAIRITMGTSSLHDGCALALRDLIV